MFPLFFVRIIMWIYFIILYYHVVFFGTARFQIKSVQMSIWNDIMYKKSVKWIRLKQKKIGYF